MLNVGSTYWNEFHALTKDDVFQDEEGVQTLRNLARNMTWLMKCIKAGRDVRIAPPVAEEDVFTNFVRLTANDPTFGSATRMNCFEAARRSQKSQTQSDFFERSGFRTVDCF